MRELFSFKFISYFIPDIYYLYVEPYSWSPAGGFIEYDETDKMSFEIIDDIEKAYEWQPQYWGSIKLPKCVVSDFWFLIFFIEYEW